MTRLVIFKAYPLFETLSIRLFLQLFLGVLAAGVPIITFSPSLHNSNDVLLFNNNVAGKKAGNNFPACSYLTRQEFQDDDLCA